MSKAAAQPAQQKRLPWGAGCPQCSQLAAGQIGVLSRGTAMCPIETDKKFLLLFSKRSAFFFEKKQQKTFIHWSHGTTMRCAER
jgi:hypothetical protein